MVPRVGDGDPSFPVHPPHHGADIILCTRKKVTTGFSYIRHKIMDFNEGSKLWHMAK